MNKPNSLKKNDKVAIIAPSSSADHKRVEKAKKAIEKLGLIPILYPSCYEKHGHFSGTDKIRAKDINDAFNSPKICNMVTYHGPMAAAGLINNTDDYTMKYFNDALFSKEPIGTFNNPDNEEITTLVKGNATGEIIGGNLSLIVSTLGSKYEIDVKDKILFIEDVHEPNYKIDRMLTSLSLANKFKDCSGIILGTFTGCEQILEPDIIILNQHFLLE